VFARLLQEARCDLVQLWMDDGEKLIASVLVTLPPISQPTRSACTPCPIINFSAPAHSGL
jgi:hypothetical protein